jgi:hypothetical protein
MTSELRQRHLAHAITLAQHVRTILTQIRRPATPGRGIIDLFDDDAAAIDVSELLLHHLQPLHDDCKKPAAT